ncbi:MAG: hypothetical protein GEU90_20730 [Gemmatimonas sp.]|nr:hypothetical protein [Gemmatimonas sp.]
MSGTNTRGGEQGAIPFRVDLGGLLCFQRVFRGWSATPYADLVGPSGVDDEASCFAEAVAVMDHRRTASTIVRISITYD